jgi:hypothetical protein
MEELQKHIKKQHAHNQGSLVTVHVTPREITIMKELQKHMWRQYAHNQGSLVTVHVTPREITNVRITETHKETLRSQPRQLGYCSCDSQRNNQWENYRNICGDSTLTTVRGPKTCSQMSNRGEC